MVISRGFASIDPGGENFILRVRCPVFKIARAHNNKLNCASVTNLPAQYGAGKISVYFGSVYTALQADYTLTFLALENSYK